ncbi:lytic murein transglycosylase B [Neisseria leonii]|uniref:lytic murein transglycosylase B n=1 Tax=Neisseria leonii TaxID=2995413 RepID=UPI00237C1CD7|nr:lytic murein transglycosylase B [Neisseria sp. 3986]MDD9325309.1 lytic murein transglycosylase B [Neisseria sp. 3986]
MKKQWFLSAAAAAVLAACGSVPSEQQSTAGSRTPAAPAQAVGQPVFDAAQPSVAETGFPNHPNVQNFIRHEAAQGRLNRVQLEDFFAQAAYKGNIINIMNQPGTAQPWYRFRANNAGSAKINGGRAFYAQNRQVIDQVARQYGVPAEIIVAIVGIETNYGRNMGSFRLADSLSTLAFDYPRRSAFFQQELREMLLMSREENQDPLSFVGSYAGAMGMPQFMPSSYRKWAVDYDGDGKRNIWGSVPDVAASVANYLKAHGWKSGAPVMVPVSLTLTPQLQALIDEKTELKYTVGQLRDWGVEPLGSVADHERAVLFRLETAPDQYDYFIGLNNFYAVWKYNNSRMYVTAVRDIANGIGAGGL